MPILEKAKIFDPASPSSSFNVQFNPNSLEYSAGKSRLAHKGVQQQSGSGGQKEPQMQSSPLEIEYGSVLSVKLFYHTYESPDDFSDVRTDINRIRAFLPPAKVTGKTNVSNNSFCPKISFAWGTLTHTGTLESFHVSYQMFAHDGTPVQAEVSISIRGEDPDVTAESNNQALSPSDAKTETELPEGDDDSLLEDIDWLFE